MDTPMLNEIMNHDLSTVPPDATLAETAQKMSVCRMDSLLVCPPLAGSPLGIVTESDLLAAWRENLPGSTPVADIMNQPVLSVPLHTNVLEAAKHMIDRGVRHLLVTNEDGSPAGMASLAAVSRHLGLNYFRYLRHVSTVMDSDPPYMPAHGTLGMAADFMQSRRSSCIILVDEQKKPVGIITSAGLLRAAAQGKGRRQKISEAAMPNPACVAATDSIAETIEKMQVLDMRHMPVVDAEGHLAGIFDGRSLVEHLSELSRNFLSPSEHEALCSSLDFQGFFHQSTQFIGILDENGKVLEVNDNIVIHSGAPRAALVGKLMWETPLWQHENAEHGKLQAALQHAKEGRCLPFETLHRTADGRSRWMLVRISKIQQQPDTPMRLIAEGVDISLQHQAEERLKLAAGIFRDTQDPIFSVDSNGIIREANGAFFALAGLQDDAQVIGRPITALCLGSIAPRFFSEVFMLARANDHWQGEISGIKAAPETNGRHGEYLLSISSVRGTDNQISQYVFLFIDISGGNGQLAEQKRKAYCAGLTGLPKRIAFINQLMQSLATAKGRFSRLGLICLEASGLRTINAACGRTVGDLLLTEVAGRLDKLLRREDVFARLSGTEFALIVNNLEQVEELEAVLARVRQLFDQSFAIHGHTLKVEAAMGATFYPDDDAAANILLAHAELALHEAKRQGGSRWELFEPEGNQQEAARRGRKSHAPAAGRSRRHQEAESLA
jgi:diguanylate cyclase (GGDEF)-like protein/PAS domain S-box-containing protein